MKKVILALLVACLALPVAAEAASKKPAKKAAAGAMDDEPTQGSGGVPGQPDTDGCGLGWQVTSKKTIAASLTRGTTNGVIPPSFGMTSGTLGCAQHPWAKRDQDSAVYALSNYESLRLEMAEGRGEYLEGFARVMGCSDSAMGEFGQMTQSNYKTIVEGGRASAVRMFLNVKQQIKSSPVLSRQCSA